MVFDTSSIQWNYKRIIARIPLLFQNNDLPVKLCQNQYFPSYQHSLKCSGSNNDMKCFKFERGNIQGIRQCEYDTKTSSPLPDENKFCCLGQSAYTCCIRRCGFDNTKCYDDDPDLNHVLFHKMDSEHQRRTANIGGVKSGCYSAMGNIDKDKIFNAFGHAKPRCVNDVCILSCLPEQSKCPTKSCSTARCFNDSEDCSHDGNWTIDLKNETIDPATLSGSVICEFYYEFPRLYSIVDTNDLYVWITDLILYVVPELSYPLAVHAIFYQTTLLFYNDIYHQSNEALNQFNNVLFISKNTSQIMTSYKQSLIGNFQEFVPKLVKNGSIDTLLSSLILPYAENGDFYIPISTAKMDEYLSIGSTNKVSKDLSNILSLFLQEDKTSIMPSSIVYQSSPIVKWSANDIDKVFVHVLEWSFQKQVTVSVKKQKYTDFIKNTANKFVLSFHIPVEIMRFSPMLVAYLESNGMLPQFPLEKILQDVPLFPLSFLKTSSPDLYANLTTENCYKDITNHRVMTNPELLFLIRPSNNCACIRSSLVPTQVKYENDYNNKTSMCFQKDCQNKLSREAYGLSNTFCALECQEMSSWIPSLTSTTNFDKTYFDQVCPIPNPPKPINPIDNQNIRKILEIVALVITLLFITFLIFYFGVNKLFVQV